jgi:hypothetical protein
MLVEEHGKFDTILFYLASVRRPFYLCTFGNGDGNNQEAVGREVICYGEKTKKCIKSF